MKSKGKLLMIVKYKLGPREKDIMKRKVIMKQMKLGYVKTKS